MRWRPSGEEAVRRQQLAQLIEFEHTLAEVLDGAGEFIVTCPMVQERKAWFRGAARAGLVAAFTAYSFARDYRSCRRADKLIRQIPGLSANCPAKDRPHGPSDTRDIPLLT